MSTTFISTFIHTIYGTRFGLYLASQNRATHTIWYNIYHHISYQLLFFQSSFRPTSVALLTTNTNSHNLRSAPHRAPESPSHVPIYTDGRTNCEKYVSSHHSTKGMRTTLIAVPTMYLHSRVRGRLVLVSYYSWIGWKYSLVRTTYPVHVGRGFLRSSLLR